MNINEVLHALIDAEQGTGLDKDAAHAAVDDEYPELVPAPVVEPAAEQSSPPTVAYDDGIPPEG